VPYSCLRARHPPGWRVLPGCKVPTPATRISGNCTVRYSGKFGAPRRIGPQVWLGRVVFEQVPRADGADGIRRSVLTMFIPVDLPDNQARFARCLDVDQNFPQFTS
jgi:hypothetical protein